MARPREFDIEEVAEAICQVFWQKGYRHTSIQDLVDATGLKRASLYAAFGNKQALFRRALSCYVAELEAHAKGAENPEILVRGWLKGMLRRSVQTEPPRGCLLLNSISELQHLDDEEREAVLAHKKSIEGVFVRSIGWIYAHRGVEISEEEVQGKAWALLTTLLGLSVLSRGGEALEVLLPVAEGALETALGPQARA